MLFFDLKKHILLNIVKVSENFQNKNKLLGMKIPNIRLEYPCLLQAQQGAELQLLEVLPEPTEPNLPKLRLLENISKKHGIDQGKLKPVATKSTSTPYERRRPLQKFKDIPVIETLNETSFN